MESTLAEYEMKFIKAVRARRIIRGMFARWTRGRRLVELRVSKKSQGVYK